MASIIGIKIANGEFYPILEENSFSKKRLILTTVHDNQPSVQIDVYRSSANVITDAQYIGSLVVENIEPKPKGEPSIELVISSDSNGEIVAEAVDLDSGADREHHVLTVSLKSLDETSRDIKLPDFELETHEKLPVGLYRHAERIRQQQEKPSRMWIFVLIGLVLILGLVALWLFLFDGLEKVDEIKNRIFAEKTVQAPEPVERQPEPVRQSEPVKEPEPVKQPEPEPVQPEPVKVTEPTPVIQAPVSPPPPRPASRARTSGRRPPVASYNVPATIPREGVDYRIRWGDTLWDISEAFYRDPWLYPRIARHNNIRNPNRIISGRTIRIPPKN